MWYLAGVSSENDFQWLCQLRYYWEENNVIARMINASIKYQYEYLGNSGRCVDKSNEVAPVVYVQVTSIARFC